jgi:hypothetical protein
MPRCFFHSHDGTDQPDDEGMEFPDFRAAHSEAVRACGEMVRDIDGDLPVGSEWRMDVSDETGRTILNLRFSQTIPPA